MRILDDSLEAYIRWHKFNIRTIRASLQHPGLYTGILPLCVLLAEQVKAMTFNTQNAVYFT